MAGLFEIAALLAVVYDGDLLVAAFLDELRGDFGPVNVRRADFGRSAVVDEKDFVERELVTGLMRALEFFDVVDAALLYEVLFAACFDDRYLRHRSYEYNPYPHQVQYSLAFSPAGATIAAAGNG